MDILWSPWRYDYIKNEDKSADSGCIFCSILNSSANDEEKFILHRAEHNFVVLNIYPYISGHLMIVPYVHIANLADASKECTDELMDLTKQFQQILQEVYRPDGTNLGMNQGKAAGAGVAQHFHMHLLPRWVGDANFMTAISQTRTIPETLITSFEKIKEKL